MASFDLKIDIEGEKQIAARLFKINKRAENFKPAFESSKRLLLKTWQSNFRSEGRELGEPWKALSPVTLLEKRRAGFGGKRILERTGAMRAGFVGFTNRDSLVLSNKTNYFKYHQSNKPRSSNLPRRVMMKIDQKRRNDILRIFRKHVLVSERGFV